MQGAQPVALNAARSPEQQAQHKSGQAPKSAPKTAPPAGAATSISERNRQAALARWRQPAAMPAGAASASTCRKCGAGTAEAGAQFRGKGCLSIAGKPLVMGCSPMLQMPHMRGPVLAGSWRGHVLWTEWDVIVSCGLQQRACAAAAAAAVASASPLPVLPSCFPHRRCRPASRRRQQMATMQTMRWGCVNVFDRFFVLGSMCSFLARAVNLRGKWSIIIDSSQIMLCTKLQSSMDGTKSCNHAGLCAESGAACPRQEAAPHPSARQAGGKACQQRRRRRQEDGVGGKTL